MKMSNDCQVFIHENDKKGKQIIDQCGQFILWFIQQIPTKYRKKCLVSAKKGNIIKVR